MLKLHLEPKMQRQGDGRLIQVQQQQRLASVGSLRGQPVAPAPDCGGLHTRDTKWPGFWFKMGQGASQNVSRFLAATNLVNVKKHKVFAPVDPKLRPESGPRFVATPGATFSKHWNQ